jgi:RNA polymerase sigma-70 factor (ECF subfamily)
LEAQQEGRLETALGKAARGDQTGFAEIVREHQGMVFSIAYHFLRNNSLAEELAQEVFLHLYQNLSKIQSPAHLKYWLRRVTAHRCIDQSRRQKFRQEVALEEIPEPSIASSSPDLMLSERLQKTIASLPEKQRMIVILRYQEELGPAEIAEVLKMPVNTVKSTLNRSLAELRKKLARSFGEMKYAIF